MAKDRKDITVEELDGEVKLKADKKDDDKDSDDEDEDDADDKDDDKDDKDMKKESVADAYDVPAAITESVTQLFEGEEFSDEFRSKVATIVETVVKSAVKSEIAKIEEEAAEAIEVKVAAIEADLIEQLDEYMDVVVAEWVEQNKVALESGLRSKIAEDFITDLRGLFEKHNIDISPEQEDIFQTVSEENDVLRQEVNSLVEATLEKDAKIFALEKDKVMAKLSEGLAMTQVEKFAQLVEDVDAATIETFEEKASVIRKTFFEGSADKQKVKTNLTEAKTQPEGMNSLVESLKKLNKKD